MNDAWCGCKSSSPTTTCSSSTSGGSSRYRRPERSCSSSSSPSVTSARRSSSPRIFPFDEWTETFGSERLTGALLDRLTHHVHILEMNGESFRLNHSRARKTVPTG